MTIQEKLREIEAVIQKGPYQDTWVSLSQYEIPKWYRDAKFGIFIHWGVYSVPAFGNEWYPRNMYQKGTPEYEHHLKTYGPLTSFGYKDFIPMFKAEKFDPDQWAALFQQSGARYVMPVAEHHDGFQMYDSELSDWNAKKMGPHRDIVGELKEAVEKRGMVFSASYHRAEHCWFFNGGLACDSDVQDPAYQDFYGKQQGEVRVDHTHDIYSAGPAPEHCEEWLARICELVDRYQPKIVWFDWWIHNVGFKPYLKKFAAYYYNRAAEWGTGVAINYKYNAFAYGTAVFDVERGQLESIRPDLWQTDTAIAKNSWGYTENNDFKNPVDIVCDLVDIVSKNGCLLLNVGPKSDGTITQEETEILQEIGKWMQCNGEGIYGTRHWQVYGEGPTRIAEGAFTDVNRAAFTSEDIRFTYKDGILYGFVMRYPEDGVIRIKSCKRVGVVVGGGDFDIRSISVLGHEDLPVTFERNDKELTVRVEGRIDTAYPVCLKMVLD